MEATLESTLNSLEKRTEKLHKWSTLNIQVQSQEVAALEAAAAELQQQQQQLQQRRLRALPALEDAAVQEVQLLKEDREKLLQHMASDGDRLLDDLKQFHKAKETLGEARKAIDEHMRARQESEGAINEMINDLRQEARRDLNASRVKREEAEEQLLQLLEDSCARVEAALLQSSALQSRPALLPPR